MGECVWVYEGVCNVCMSVSEFEARMCLTVGDNVFVV